tara:strand:+ start:62 stop:910 length:849 start_codon:yes stop_codon:yes gene_type:complete
MKLVVTLIVLFFLSINVPALAQSEASKLLQEGHKLNRTGDLDGAIEFYKKSLKADPGYSAAKYSLKGALKKQAILKIVKTFDPVCQKSSNDFNVIKLCLEKHLFFNGQPLHPSIVQEFITWLSDTGDQIISINLRDAFSSNRYCCDDSFSVRLTGKKMVVRTDFTKDYDTFNDDYISQEDCGGICAFTYAHLGTTDNGAMVIQVWESSGGSGLFSTLLFTKVKERMGANFDYANPSNLAFDKQQIVLEKLFSISLGDRQETSISVNGNFVVLNDTKIKIPSH